MNRGTHVKALAIISTGRYIYILHQTCAGSFLKSHESHPVQLLSAVSPAAQEAVVKYTSNSAPYLLDVASIDFLLWR